jgi:hypothetical protein
MVNISTTVRGHYGNDVYLWAIIIRRFCDNGRSSSPLSNDESEKWRENKLTGLCFVAMSIHVGYCTMVVDEGVKPNKDVLLDDDDTTEVKPTVDALIAELDVMTDALMSQDKLLKCAAHERKEFKDKLEIVERELEEAKNLVVHISDEVSAMNVLFI